MKLTLQQLLDAINEVPADQRNIPVVFQGNIHNEESEEPETIQDDPTHTVSTGYVFAGFLRSTLDEGDVFVIDAAIEASEV